MRGRAEELALDGALVSVCFWKKPTFLASNCGGQARVARRIYRNGTAFFLSGIVTTPCGRADEKGGGEFPAKRPCHRLWVSIYPFAAQSARVCVCVVLSRNGKGREHRAFFISRDFCSQRLGRSPDFEIPIQKIHHTGFAARVKKLAS